MAEEEKQETKPPEWQQRRFKINGEMEKVIDLSIKATEAEIAGLKRKLARLQYGG